GLYAGGDGTVVFVAKHCLSQYFEGADQIYLRRGTAGFVHLVYRGERSSDGVNDYPYGSALRHDWGSDHKFVRLCCRRVRGFETDRLAIGHTRAGLLGATAAG